MMGSRIIDSTSILPAPMKENENSMIFELVDRLNVKGGNLERFSSVDSFQTVRSSMQSYETALASVFPWKKIDLQSKHANSYWNSSSEDASKRTNQAHLPSHQHNVPVEGKPLKSDEKFCRICYCGCEDEELISPCKCSGSAKYAHPNCLLSWFALKQDKMCELCLCEINVKKSGFKPLKQWRLPWRACDIIASLFVFYCAVLIVFVAMVFWIASRRCLSPICVVLYFACGLAVCYFSYCCGCIEHVRHFWKVWFQSNRHWLIFASNDSDQFPGVVLRSQTSCESQKGSQFV